MRLDELDITDIGGSIQIVGCVYQGEGKTFLCLFPGELNDMPVEELEMDLEDWQKFLRQTDLREVRVLAEAGDAGTTKIILRKSSRQISTQVSWAVFERDDFRCRYCGRRGPLTVDHVITWEDGGPSTTENLISSCRKCNRVRSNTPYDEWILRHKYYKQMSRELEPDVREENIRIIGTLDAIPRMLHQHSRGTRKKN